MDAPRSSNDAPRRLNEAYLNSNMNWGPRYTNDGNWGIPQGHGLDGASFVERWLARELVELDEALIHDEAMTQVYPPDGQTVLLGLEEHCGRLFQHVYGHIPECTVPFMVGKMRHDFSFPAIFPSPSLSFDYLPKLEYIETQLGIPVHPSGCRDIRIHVVWRQVFGYSSVAPPLPTSMAVVMDLCSARLGHWDTRRKVFTDNIGMTPRVTIKRLLTNLVYWWQCDEFLDKIASLPNATPLDELGAEARPFEAFMSVKIGDEHPFSDILDKLFMKRFPLDAAAMTGYPLLTKLSMCTRELASVVTDDVEEQSWQRLV